jgi:hypothetical protein
MTSALNLGNLTEGGALDRVSKVAAAVIESVRPAAGRHSVGSVLRLSVPQLRRLVNTAAGSLGFVSVPSPPAEMDPQAKFPREILVQS